MKFKPDVSAFSIRPRDPDDFLDGALTEGQAPTSAPLPPPPASTETRTMTIEVAKPEPTVQKLFRLRWDIAHALKVGAVQESGACGRRVTETEIVERLLREHFKIDS